MRFPCSVSPLLPSALPPTQNGGTAGVLLYLVVNAFLLVFAISSLYFYLLALHMNGSALAVPLLGK